MKLQHLAMAAALDVAAAGGSMAHGTPASEVAKSPKPELGTEYKKINTFTDFRKKLITDGWIPVPNPECHDAVKGDYYEESCRAEPDSISCRLCTMVPELFRHTSDGYNLMRYTKDGVPLSVTVFGDIQDLDAPGRYGLVVVGWDYSEGLNVILLARQLKQSDVSAVVQAVMNDAYGETYDTTNACWAFTFKDAEGESAEYCMRAGKSDVVDTQDGKTLYLNAFSATDIRGEVRYGYSHVQPGLMGAFKIRLDDNKGWTYDAFDKAIDFGSNGDCGCANAKLVKLNNAGDYGWIFASGGTWQGVTVANYSIVMAIDGRMRDVSQIPQVREKAQDIKYEVSVKADPMVSGMFPLHVVETKTGGMADEFEVAFDTGKSAYVFPEVR